MNATRFKPLFAGDGAEIRDDAIPTEIYEGLLEIVPRLRWQYGWTTEEALARYWHIGIVDGGKDSTEDQLAGLEKVRPTIFSDFLHWLRDRLPDHDAALLRYYLNGHTFGTDGSPHTDSERLNEMTIVTYLTGEWMPIHGGETVVLDDDNNILAAAMPRPNRMLAFPSHWRHGPRPLSRYFTGLRITLVAKFALRPESLPGHGGIGA